MTTPIPFKLPILHLLIFISSGLTLRAQDQIAVEKITDQIVKEFSEYHLQPRNINDDFGADVHELLINSFDSRKILFSKENVTELKQLSLKIDDDINSGSLVYLIRFKELIKESIDLGEKELNSYFTIKTNIATIPVVNENLTTDFPEKSFHNKKWNLYLRDIILENLAEDLSGKEYATNKDSLNQHLLIIEKAVQSTFRDFFKNLSNEALINEAYLNAIAESYDPHSSYFSPEEMNQFDAELKSEREIFGISYIKNLEGNFEITNIVPGSSAWLSGEIQEGDLIRKVKFGKKSTRELNGLTLLEVHQLFNENTSKELEITLTNPNGEETSVILEKTKVYSDEDIIKTTILQGEKKIGYISLPDFYSNETDTTALGCANDIAKAIMKMKLENIDGLILDLRNNGGGSLKEAIDLSGIFIDFGPILINRDEENNIYSLKDINRGTIYKGPLVVMINQYSASASEIVSASLQDYNRALIVGQRSFGKATGQFVIPLDPERTNLDWGFLKITNLGLYRVDLTTNQNRGVLPDIELLPADEFKVEHEEDYPTSMTLDSINKKIYYTPLAELNSEILKQKSLDRQGQSAYFQNEKEIYKRIEILESEMSDWTNSLDKRLDLQKQIESISLDFGKNQENIDRNYEVVFLQRDNDIYLMSPFLNKYRENFKENLEMDYELIETFSILLDWIK